MPTFESLKENKILGNGCSLELVTLISKFEDALELKSVESEYKRNKVSAGMGTEERFTQLFPPFTLSGTSNPLSAWQDMSSKSNNYSCKAGNIQVGGMDGKKKGYRKRKEPELCKENRSLYLKTGREEAFHKGK